MRRYFRKTVWSRAFPALLALAALAAAGGCGVQQLARGEIQPPKVTLEGLTLGAPTGAGWPIFARLRLENPNPQAVSVLGYDYNLRLEGRNVAQGVSQGEVHLPPAGETVTEFPIVVNLSALLGLLPRALQHQEEQLHYQLAGGVRLSQVLGGLIRVPFTFQGQLSFKEGAAALRPYLR